METLVKETGNHLEMVGTCKRGEVTATLDELIKAFGMPAMGGVEDKITKQWDIQFKDDSLATIYDWKVPYPNDGSEYQWTIGGDSIDSALNVWEEIKAVKTKIWNLETPKAPIEKLIAKQPCYIYIYIDDLKIKIAESKEDPTVITWCDSLTMVEGMLLSAIADSYPVSKERSSLWEETLTLGELRTFIDAEVVKEWGVSCEVDYEAEIDLGVAGYVTAYGFNSEVNIEVQAKTEQEAKSKAVELLEDEYVIDSAKAINAKEIK